MVSGQDLHGSVGASSARKRDSQGSKAAVLIRKLNPILRGWANYHRHVVSKRTCGRVDYYLGVMLWRWARREHPNKSRRWIKGRYFRADPQGSFSVRIQDREGKERVLKACRVAQTVIERHIKVRGQANPYDPEHVEYFEKRRCFAWRTYPVGKARAFGAGQDKIATQDANEKKPDCRITSAEADLRKARAV